MAELDHSDDERTGAAYSDLRQEIGRLRRQGLSASEAAAALAFVQEIGTNALGDEYDNTPIQRLHEKYTEGVDHYGTKAATDALRSHLHDQRETK